MRQNDQNVPQEANYWPATIDEEGVLTLPDEVWQQLGWKEGDELEFIDQEDGSFLIVKVDGTSEPQGEADS